MYTGWPRSGWPQVGHFDQKIKVNQIASYCAMLYPRCCRLWPCNFWGLHSSAFDSCAGQTRGSHFNFYWGTDTTMWSYVHFLCSCVTKIDFYYLLWNWQVKRLLKQHKEGIKCVSLYLKISLNMWQAIHSLGWPRSGLPLSFTLCYKFVAEVNHPTNLLLLFEKMASNMEKNYWKFHNDTVTSFGVIRKVSVTH